MFPNRFRNILARIPNFTHVLTKHHTRLIPKRNILHQDFDHMGKECLFKPGNLPFKILFLGNVPFKSVRKIFCKITKDLFSVHLCSEFTFGPVNVYLFPPRCAMRDWSAPVKQMQPVSVEKAEGQHELSTVFPTKNINSFGSCATFWGRAPTGIPSVAAHPDIPPDWLTWS